MNLSRYAAYKRCLETYSADPAFRDAMDRDPAGALARFGPEAPGSPETVYRTIRRILFRDPDPNPEELPYLREYTALCREIGRRTMEDHSPGAIPESAIGAYLERQRNRCRMESALIREHDLVYYYPFAFELSDGCSVQCPFCGFHAAPFGGNFLHTEENARLFRAAIRQAHALTGDLAAAAPLYFATEPLDNPDYELFLQDVEDITGRMPQTTTALADRDPERIRAFMAHVGQERLKREALLRFSVRSLRQFHRIAELYSPEELAYVELLPNNPESVNRYSRSGRAAGLKNIREEKMSAYSICCTAGIHVNFVRGKITFLEPEIPDDRYPNGYSVRAESGFRTPEELAERITELAGRFMRSTFSPDTPLKLNPRVRVMMRDGSIFLTGDGIAYRLNPTEINGRLLQALGNGVSPEILLKGRPPEEQVYLRDLTEELFQKGYIREAEPYSQNIH